MIERTGTKQGTFINGGVATIEGHNLKLDRICPLDKVTFDINVENNSNVDIKYRTLIKCNSGPVLYSILDKTITTKSGDSQVEEIVNGYENYTKWTVLNAGADGATFGITIEFKNHGDIDNYYQDLSTDIFFVVEAVQSNAYTVDTLNKQSFNNVSANVVKEVATKTNEEGQQVVDETLIENADASASVIVPSHATTEGTDTPLDVNSKLKLTVEPKEEKESSFVIKETDVIAPYEIDVTKITQVGSDVVSEKLVGDADNLFQVTLFVGSGLDDVRVYHKNNLLTKVDDLISPRVDQTYFYDVVTGDIFVWTSSFSEYTIVYDNIPAIEAALLQQDCIARIGLKGYKSLYDAFDAQKDGETVVLITDVTGQDVTWQKLTKGDYAFDLEGHTMEGAKVDFARPTLQVHMKEGSTAKIFDSTNNPGMIKGYHEGYPVIDTSGSHIYGVIYLHGFSNYTSHIDVTIEDITIEAMEGSSAITNNIASSKQSIEIKSGTINGDIVLDLYGGGDVEVKVDSDADFNGKVDFIAETIAHKVDATLNDDGSTTYKTVADYSTADLLLTNRRYAQGPEINTWARPSENSFSFAMNGSDNSYYNAQICRDISVAEFTFEIGTTDKVFVDLNGKRINTSGNWTIFSCNKNYHYTMTIRDEKGGAEFDNKGFTSYYGIQVNYVNLIIEGGKFTTSKFNPQYGGTLTIKGGEFVVPDNYVDTLKTFITEGSTVIINGSSFTK